MSWPGKLANISSSFPFKFSICEHVAMRFRILHDRIFSGCFSFGVHFIAKLAITFDARVFLAHLWLVNTYGFVAEIRPSSRVSFRRSMFSFIFSVKIIEIFLPLFPLVSTRVNVRHRYCSNFFQTFQNLPLQRCCIFLIVDLDCKTLDIADSTPIERLD